jgi:hypothetical protein
MRLREAIDREANKRVVGRDGELLAKDARKLRNGPLPVTVAPYDGRELIETMSAVAFQVVDEDFVGEGLHRDPLSSALRFHSCVAHRSRFRVQAASSNSDRTVCTMSSTSPRAPIRMGTRRTVRRSVARADFGRTRAETVFAKSASVACPGERERGRQQARGLYSHTTTKPTGSGFVPTEPPSSSAV